jgi:ubiquinone/menaquinone biosynthesis C-methylase UbiE
MLKAIGDLYDKAVLPHLVDWACGVNVISKQRDKVVPRAAGEVLEIGMGTGLNLPHYDRAKVVQLTGVDPGISHGKVQKRIDASGLPVKLVDLGAERLPFGDARFAPVVVTYSLCTIPDAVSALKEMARVLKADGQLLYCEHGLAPDESVRRWQHRLTPMWSALAGGCQLDRDIPALLEEAGFHLTEPEMGYVPGPRLFMYNYWGSAHKPAC